jgi:hypothetical protein
VGLTVANIGLVAKLRRFTLLGTVSKPEGLVCADFKIGLA